MRNDVIISRFKTKAPCFKCEKRTSECHATCPEYLEYRKKHEEEREEYRRQKEKQNGYVQSVNQLMPRLNSKSNNYS